MNTGTRSVTFPGNPCRWLLFLAVSLLALAGPFNRAARAQEHAIGGITLDGSLDDWPSGELAVAGDRWMYFRYDAHRSTSLQNGPVMTVLQIDLDTDASTGLATDKRFGCDLEISMTRLDPRDPTHLDGGIEIIAFGANELHEQLNHPDIGFAFLPTHAAESFEIRLARDLRGPDWLVRMARTSRALRYRFLQRDASYKTLDAGAIRELALPALTPGKELFEAPIPAKDPGTVRIVSWNVLWGTPMKEPEGFARALRALDPDVILFQEWDNGYWNNQPRIPKDEFISWLRGRLDDERWSVFLGGDRGVVVASRAPMKPFLPESVLVGDEGGQRQHPMRCASARVMTPAGEVGAVSVHLKSRGGLNTSEDRTRLSEARAVREAIAKAQRSDRPKFLVISGDWNLVGSRDPLMTAAKGADFDGSDLLVVEPRRLGLGDAVTWRDQRSPFAPGRLDYILVADDGVEVVRAFILDAGLLTDSALQASGIERSDTEGSDHLPVVVDLRRIGDH
ncbi:MAG: endonuclease/exonuclease/phosphatase family protein [Phycisphaeraceae bacterium]|nr:endonuclease/exonuclease/phosphatase family protein [Phycisphaeraceae bacterium]